MRKKNFTRTVGVLLADDTYQQLIYVTDKYEITISEYIRELVEKGLITEEEKGK